jgi:hypothetical protein
MSLERIVSFQSWANDHPGDRLPSDRLDSQFDLHANAINALEQRIDKLLRADGKLNHGLITPESIPESLFDAIVLRILDEARAERRAAEQALAEIRYRQEDIWRRLEDAKVFVRETGRDFSRNLALLENVVAIQEDIDARLVPLTEAAERSTATLTESENTVTLTAAAAENWADVSMHWAEHMPDTLPANILATNAITGDHWSSRWWANQAAAAVGGFLFHYYLGPYPDPPLTLPNGQPVQPGMIYFDTDSGQMYVWNGSAWVSFNTPTAARTNALFYAATDGQTVFPLTVSDLYGRTVALDPTKNQGVVVFVNGARLTPTAGGFATGDYSLNLATSTITIAAPVSLNSIVGVDVLRDPLDMAVVGSVTTQKLKTFVFDGVATVFALLTAAGGAVSPIITSSIQLAIVVDGVVQEPGVDFTLSGGGTTVTFNEAPRADAKNFVVYYQPAVGSGSTTTVDWIDITGKPATFPPTLPIAQSGITNLVSDLAGKAPTVHTHTTAQVTGLDTALLGKEPSITAGASTLFWAGNKTWQKSFVQLTQAAYDALGTKDANTLYVVVG